MMKRHKVIFVVVLVVLVLAVAGIWFVNPLPEMPMAKERLKSEAPTIEKRFKIESQDEPRAPIDHRREDFSDENIETYFSDDVIDAHTYNFLKHLDDLAVDLEAEEDPLETIRQYLFDHMPADQAGKMFELYSLYLDYQINWAEQSRFKGMPLTAQEKLNNLYDLQEYRRAVFGKESADEIFGADVAAKEYTIRRNMIVFDKNLYGAEKEARLKTLANERFGDESAGRDHSTPYNRYKEKLRIYQKDLSELATKEERQTLTEQLKIDAFNQE